MHFLMVSNFASNCCILSTFDMDMIERKYNIFIELQGLEFLGNPRRKKYQIGTSMWLWKYDTKGKACSQQNSKFFALHIKSIFRKESFYFVLFPKEINLPLQSVSKNQDDNIYCKVGTSFYLTSFNILH